MLSKRKYHFYRNKSFIRSIIVMYLSLTCLLIQGCSSDMDNAKIIERRADRPIESIGAPKLVIEKSLYDFGEITPNSKKTAIFNFTNLGDKPLQVKGTLIRLNSTNG